MARSEDAIWGGKYWNRKREERIQSRKCLEIYGYKAYSQNDEDGIIAEIFNRIGTTNKVFVEFGVQNGLESNGYLLLMKGWRGLWIEGSKKYCKEINIRFRPVIDAGMLKVRHSFVDKDNINSIISSGIDDKEIDLLSIDIDGNDYYVWESINVVLPRVVCVEYNGKIPPDVLWKQAYNPKHVWDGSDWHGASLKAYEMLGREKGYQLVGTNISGVNAFFVRNDLLGDHFLSTGKAEDLYNPLNLDCKHWNGHPPRWCLAGQDGSGIGQYVTGFRERVFIKNQNTKDRLIRFLKRIK